MIQISWHQSVTSEVEEKSTNGKPYSYLTDNDGIVAHHLRIAQAMRMIHEALAGVGHKVAGSTFQDSIATDCFKTDKSLATTTS